MSSQVEPVKLDALHAEMYAAGAESPHHRIVMFERMNAECPDPECSQCAAMACPHHHPFHFHHDGCPACEGCDGPYPEPLPVGVSI